MCLMMRLWEFQNGKMGVYRQKIDQDTVKIVKILILKNNSFCKKPMIFLYENCNFSKFGLLHFLLYLGQFFAYIHLFYHFGILKVSSLSRCMFISIIISIKNAMKKNRSVIFFYPDSKSTLLSTIWPIKSDQSCVIWSFHGVFARSFSDSTYLAREMIEKKLARPWKKVYYTHENWDLVTGNYFIL